MGMGPKGIRALRTFCYWSSFALGFTGKIPQVWAIECSKKAEGISTTAIAIEILGHLIVISYSLQVGKPPSAFFENVNGFIQGLLLLFVTLSALNKLTRKRFGFLAFGYSLVILIAQSQVILYRRAPPLHHLLIKTAAPILSLSKIVQLHYLWWAGTAKDLSLETWIISAFCSAANLVSLLSEPPIPGGFSKTENLARSSETVNLCMSFSLSLSVVFYAIFLRYKNKNLVKFEKKSK